MDKGLFISDYNNYFQKWLIFEDDGITGWAYLTDKTSKNILVDCWVYNRIEAPDITEIHKFKNTPPPAPKQHIINTTHYKGKKLKTMMKPPTNLYIPSRHLRREGYFFTNHHPYHGHFQRVLSPYHYQICL
jgi:hypothetical protein